MKVYVKPCGPVAMRLNRSGEVEVMDGISLLDLKQELGLPRNYPVLYAVNGTNAPQETLLHNGDNVTIINIVSGG